MIQVNNLHRFLFIFLFTFSFNAIAEEGEKIFKQNCISCHTIGSGRLIGPDLSGITKKRDTEWLKKWITNNASLRASGDVDAISIFEQYNKVAMTAFDFSDKEMSDLLAYLATEVIKEEVITDGKGDKRFDQGISTTTLLVIVAIILIILVFILTSIKNKLKSGLHQPTETVFESLINLNKVFWSNSSAVLIVVFIVLIGFLKVSYAAMMGIGVTTNYQPEQPIAFSHKIHAGDNGIDCNYCHSSARHSKSAGIPSVNVCMNCHAYISSGTNTGETEIEKIYDAIGYDVETRSYIHGYRQKPIKWVRIHNLSDLTYFNHSQHVTVGKVKCQECHGPIEEMDVVKQQNDLTMGWCINCHKETEVKMEGNNYYFRIHEQMKEKYAGEKITVDKIGGLECSKCHY